MPHHIKKPIVKNGKLHPRGPFDYLVYFFALTTPLFEVPQAVLIYSRHDAEGVSIATWGFFALSSLAWTLYGWHVRSKLLVTAHGLYLAVEAFIVAGIIRYS